MPAFGVVYGARPEQPVPRHDYAPVVAVFVVLLVWVSCHPVTVCRLAVRFDGEGFTVERPFRVPQRVAWAEV